LLDDYHRSSRDEVLLKLASFPKSSIEETLLSRGHDPNSIKELKDILALVGAPFTPNDAVVYSFSKRGSPPA
jgi:predicted glycosyltransferase